MIHGRPSGGAPDDAPLLLLIVTGRQCYREYLLKSISSRYRVHLLLGADPTWEQDYITSWTVLKDMQETIDAAEQIGYPVVLKPRALAASLGVVRVDTPEELAAQFAFARDTTVPGAWEYDPVVLVEECLMGPEISVDAAVHRGQVFPMFAARKEVGYPPYFEEVGHVVDAADPLLAEPEILQILQSTHTALGFDDGMTHTELKLTPAGPKIVEVNARLGGDMIPYLGLRTSGIDPGLAAAAVACGQQPRIVADRELVGAVRVFYVEQDDTTIGDVHFDDSGLPEAADLLVPLAAPGDVVSPPPKGSTFGRIAFATAVARECARVPAGARRSAGRADRAVPRRPTEHRSRESDRGRFHRAGRPNGFGGMRAPGQRAQAGE
ncbi:MAG: ATP-grasp domain-containing protein [Nocardioidaceae bacterium]